MGRGSKNLWGEGLRGVMGAGFSVCVGGLRAVGAWGCVRGLFREASVAECSLAKVYVTILVWCFSLNELCLVSLNGGVE